MAELAGHVEVVDITTHVVAPGPVAEEAVILKSGTLTKEGSFVKSWKSAWFELTARQMTYYNDSNTMKRYERGYFMLGDVESIRYCPRKYESVQCLAVATRTRTFYLRGSKEELSEWLIAISKAVKALRYTHLITLVAKDVFLLALVLRDPILAKDAEKVAKKDAKRMEKISKLNLTELVQSEYLWTHERLAVQHLCHAGFASPAEGGALLLALCEYGWTRETREVPRVALIALLGLGADPGPATRFYESTDWVKEYTAVTHYGNNAKTKVTVTETGADGVPVTKTVVREGRGPITSTIWSSSCKKKLCAPDTWAIIEDHPRWRG